MSNGVATAIATLISKAGDSGAPVYNSSGELVALIEGGNGKGDTTITPISFLEKKASKTIRLVIIKQINKLYQFIL